MVNGKKRGIVEVSSNVNQEKLIEIIDNEKKISLHMYGIISNQYGKKKVVDLKKKI